MVTVEVMRCPSPARAALAAALAAATACGGSSTTPPATPAGAAPAARAATIRWTEHGVPHVEAADLGGLGFGQGYAMARAHLCVMADQFLRVRGERARHFGPGDDDAHVDSDFANLHLGWRARAEAMLPQLSPDARAMIDGVAAGYRHYLARTPRAAWPAPCRDGAWVAPVDGADVLAVVLATAALASSRFLEGAIARAAPGAALGAAPAALPDRRDLAAASNAWGLGADRTASGGGILVGNPHFPWEGDLVFFELHLTAPGLDVYGATLVGVPGIAIGMTARHAWSHTFSSSTHMALYRLELDAASPLRYRAGDATAPIVPTTYRIEVAGPDGARETRTRTLYRSALGPMIVTAQSPWDGAGGHAFTVRDVALIGPAQLDQPLAMARAASRAAFEEALALSATPFVNTVYADADGDALYVDGSRVPALSEPALGAWRIARKVVPAVEAAWRRGVVILDGSNPLFELEAFDPGAPGAIPIALAPRLVRRDFVMNANDSYRFTNPAAPAVEHSPLYGEDDGQPSPRTLANLALLRPGDPAAGPDGRFTLDEAAAAMLSGRSFTAERLRADVLAACRPPAAAARPRERPTPCEVLAAWDGRYTADSRGAALWRELTVGLAVGGELPWRQGFDRQAATSTPAGLAVDRPVIVAALDAAADRLVAAGLALDAPLGAVQHAPRGEARVPVPGGDELDGVANVVGYRHFNASLLPRTPRGPASPSGLTVGGYVVNYGSSFILAAELGPDGARGKALLTYGNSSDPASPHYRDQLAAFAAGALRDVRFTAAAIAADPTLVVEELVEDRAGR